MALKRPDSMGNLDLPKSIGGWTFLLNSFWICICQSLLPEGGLKIVVDVPPFASKKSSVFTVVWNLLMGLILPSVVENIADEESANTGPFEGC